MRRYGVMTMGKYSLTTLNPVIESAREELADMDEDDVPASLRKIARSSARRLPPPLARSMIQELTRIESFRSAVAQRYGQLHETDPDLVAFLEDPASGLARIEQRAAEMTTFSWQADLREASRMVEKLTDQLAEAHARAATMRTAHEQELAAARLSVSERQIRLESRVEGLVTEVSARQEEIAILVAEVDMLKNELTSARDRIRLAVARSRRRDVSGSAPVREVKPDATPSDPVELARWLDTVERNVRPFRASGSRARDLAEVEPFVMEPGIAPDSGVAISSLLEKSPERFILDGYNLAGELYDAEFSTRAARDDIVNRAARLARSSEAEVVVVFDGKDDQARSRFRSSGGVVVRFSRGEKADDVIASMVASDSMRTVVITNDRELRDRCTAVDCVPIWSTAFFEWHSQV